MYTAFTGCRCSDIRAMFASDLDTAMWWNQKCREETTQEKSDGQEEEDS